MQLEDFWSNLHFDVNQTRFSEASVDWDDAPLPYKLYQGVPHVALPRPSSLPTKADAPSERAPSLAELGTLLWYTYGVSQQCHTVIPTPPDDNHYEVKSVLRRYVPSGGALYPSEVYVYLQIDDVENGVYHYDVAHHRLDSLRLGKLDVTLESALPGTDDLSRAFAVIFVSTVFWKNFFKYHDFAYRLQGIDAGLVVGQVLQVADLCGYANSVHYQFLDGAMNRLLGLTEEEESVYAIIPLQATNGVCTRAATPSGASQEVTDDALCSKLPSLQHRHYSKSKRILPCPMVNKANRAAMFHSTSDFIKPSTEGMDPQFRSCNWVPLPHDGLSLADFSTACRERYSPGFEFISQSVTLKEIATVLRQTMSLSYGSDIHKGSPTHGGRHPSIQLGVCVHGVDDVPDGAYIYDEVEHGLRGTRKGDVRMELQAGISLSPVNLFQVPVCLHVVGSGDFLQAQLGHRGYRIQQMEVGIVLQHLLLAVSAIGLGAHPLLDYDEGACDRIYGLDSHKQTCLVQVPVGRYRKASRFEAALARA